MHFELAIIALNVSNCWLVIGGKDLIVSQVILLCNAYSISDFGRHSPYRSLFGNGPRRFGFSVRPTVISSSVFLRARVAGRVSS